MDPFSIFMLVVLFSVLVIVATPFVTMFNTAIRIMTRSVKKTHKTIRT